MLRSESVGKVLAAIQSARPKFKPILKDRLNPAYKSKYADLGSYLDSIEDAMAGAGLMLMQPTVALPDAPMVVETIITHVESQEYVGSTYPVIPAKADPQGLGGALSYARRYSLAALLGLTAEDDDGNHASGHGHGHDRYNGPQRPQERPQAPPQRPAGPRAEPPPEPPRAAPPKPFKTWIVAAAARLDIHPQRLINHLGKALATLQNDPVPPPPEREAYLARSYFDAYHGAQIRSWLADECRRYRDKLASEPATDEADPDPDDELGSRE